MIITNYRLNDETLNDVCYIYIGTYQSYHIGIHIHRSYHRGI